MGRCCLYCGALLFGDRGRKPTTAFDNSGSADSDLDFRPPPPPPPILPAVVAASCPGGRSESDPAPRTFGSDLDGVNFGRGLYVTAALFRVPTSMFGSWTVCADVVTVTMADIVLRTRRRPDFALRIATGSSGGAAADVTLFLKDVAAPAAAVLFAAAGACSS